MIDANDKQTMHIQMTRDKYHIETPRIIGKVKWKYRPSNNRETIIKKASSDTIRQHNLACQS